MKAHYFRSWESEYYLVPEHDRPGFDTLTERIDAMDDGDAKDGAYDEFNDKYQQYKCEGELFDTKLFIEK